MKQEYNLVLGIYRQDSRVSSYLLEKNYKRFDLILHFVEYYKAKLNGEYDELLKGYQGYIELEVIEDGKLINIEEVEVRM